MPKLTRKEKRAINQAKFRASRGDEYQDMGEHHDDSDPYYRRLKAHALKSTEGRPPWDSLTDDQKRKWRSYTDYSQGSRQMYEDCTLTHRRAAGINPRRKRSRR
jgi:hypothetical protein